MNRRPMIKAAVIAIAALTAGAIPAFKASAQSDVVVETETVIPVDPAAAAPAETTAQEAPPDAVGAPAPGASGAILSIRIKRVINRAGNNPYFVADPVENADGELIADNDATGAGLDGCLGSIAFAQSPTAPAGIFFAGVDADPNTLDCRLRNDGQGPAIIFQIDTGFAPVNEVEAFSDVLVGTFQLTPVANVRFFPGQAQTLTVQAITGRAFEIDVIVDQSGAQAFTLRVTGIRQTA